MLKLRPEQLETLRRELLGYITEEDIHFRTKENQIILQYTFVDSFLNRLKEKE